MTQTPTHFADRLHARMDAMNSVVCVGLDPVLSRLPAVIVRNVDPSHAQAAVIAIKHFCLGVLEAVEPHAAAVKFQSACFERYHWLGVKLLHELIDHARQMGLIVINDAKRGDIGISSAHYAAGCLSDSRFTDLGDLAGPDALTVNAYLGIDAIAPLVETASAQGKGLFALVRTSNPGSDLVQSPVLSDTGGTIANHVAAMIAQTGDAPGYLGQTGYSHLGAVVGATHPADAADLRATMPHQVFLLPGFGAQGADADDVLAGFDARGRGALVTASRSVIYAFGEAEGSTDSQWRQAVSKAASKMRDQLNTVLNR